MAREESGAAGTPAPPMSLNTIINAGLTRPSRPVYALVLMGGGARTAYQVGVLKALGGMLKLRGGHMPAFPFQVLIGTSAGALNVAYLASTAMLGLDAFGQLGKFWERLRSADVYELQLSRWVRFSRLVAATAPGAPCASVEASSRARAISVSSSSESTAARCHRR